MRCLSPRTVGFMADGKTISWSPKSYSKEYASFQLPCGKCIECRLEYARQWAVRCVHEARMYEENSFITLTYADEHLKSPKLQYRDFQLFAKKLRKKIFTDFVGEFGKENWAILTSAQRKEQYGKIKIGIFVTGEYGEDKKRPHWHAIIFNWRPADCEYYRSNDRGDRIFTSRILEELWTFNDTKKRPNEIGDVSFHSAGYVARYAAKKLVHGYDNEEWNPISKKSSHQAIGKRYLEKNWPDIFNYGHVVLDDGKTTSIPRYYEKWLKEKHPAEWLRYVTEVKFKKMKNAEERSMREEEAYWSAYDKRDQMKPTLINKFERRHAIITEKFKRLQTYLKGDI